ncbi:MAG TPA: hypothetical protein PKW25_09460 [Syntrophomonadaceae bacterium]|nr:hypothetical protein [Syntrophomonadaceae bacterium]
MQDTDLFMVIAPSSSTPEELRVALPERLIVKVAVRRPVELRRAVRVIVASSTANYPDSIVCCS